MEDIVKSQHAAQGVAARAPVFAQTYQSYLEQLRDIDLPGRAATLGAETRDDGLLVRLFNREYQVSGTTICDQSGREVSPAVMVMLARYVLLCPPQAIHGGSDLMHYRQFPGAAPLVSYFAANVTARIEQSFTGGTDRLIQQALAIGGSRADHQSYDTAFRFVALPRIPVSLYFNDQDDLFPAACSVLFTSSAQHFLDMECLAMVGTMLAALLSNR